MHARVMDVICASLPWERGEKTRSGHTVKLFFFSFNFIFYFFILVSDDGLTGHYAFAEFQYSDFAPTS